MHQKDPVAAAIDDLAQQISQAADEKAFAAAIVHAIRQQITEPAVFRKPKSEEEMARAKQAIEDYIVASKQRISGWTPHALRGDTSPQSDSPARAS
ncbi:hypothetical protein H0A70_05270 [Alcaligenaceae bacterium]|nr:hypothetical protein [Alcaligenaceae bacterium]